MSATFTVQVNNSGAWRNVVRGTKDQMGDIEHHSAMIARVVGKGYKWRIIDAAFCDVLGYCNSETNFEWVPVK